MKAAMTNAENAGLNPRRWSAGREIERLPLFESTAAVLTPRPDEYRPQPGPTQNASGHEAGGSR